MTLMHTINSHQSVMTGGIFILKTKRMRDIERCLFFVAESEVSLNDKKTKKIHRRISD